MSLFLKKFKEFFIISSCSKPVSSWKLWYQERLLFWTTKIPASQVFSIGKLKHRTGDSKGNVAWKFQVFGACSGFYSPDNIVFVFFLIVGDVRAVLNIVISWSTEICMMWPTPSSDKGQEWYFGSYCALYLIYLYVLKWDPPPPPFGLNSENQHF